MAKRIGELLVESGVLAQTQLEQALFAQRKDGRKLGQILIELGLASEIQLTQALSRQLSVPWVSLYHIDFSRSLLNLVPRELAEKYCLVPIFVRRVRKLGETLYVAMDDPTNDSAIDEVARAASLPAKPMIACPSDIRAAIRVYYLGDEAPPPPVALEAARPARVASARPLPAPPPPAPVASAPVATAPVAKAPVAIAPAATAALPAQARASAEKVASDAAPAEGEEVVEPKRPSKRRGRAKMISLTLLDGTTVSLPGPPKKRGSKPDLAEEAAATGEVLSDQLTARDLVSALRAIAHGVDASDILGAQPKWEAMFSVLLSILLRKGLIADWEFVEEFRKI